PIIAVALSRDGSLIAAAGVRGSVAIIDRRARKLERTLVGPGLPVWSAAFFPDGRTLLTGGSDRMIRRWDPGTGEPIGHVGMGGPGDPLAPFAGDPGAEVFRACVACHTLNANDGVRAGPTLADIFGRRIATLPGYNFSDALKKLDIVWTPEKVSKLFEVGPMTYTPGTKMPEQRIGSAEDRAALVKFLEKATKTPGARAYRRSSRCADQFENGIGNRAGCFLRQIVAGSRDHSMLIRAGKVSGVLEGAFRRREAAAVAVQHDGRYRNTRLGGQPPLNRFQARIAAGVAETVTVGMDHNLDKIRIVERHAGAVVGRVIQPPIRRPQPPQ